jgi:glycogen(starch) synthase
LLEAFGRVKDSFPDAELEIIGYGPEKPALHNRVNKNDALKGISFSESVEHGKLVEKYQGARVLALPSLIGEGFGMTAAEAAACGIPTVTFGLGGTAELVVDGGTGLITGQNAESLANGLIRLFRDEGLVDEMGKRARKRMEDFYSWEIIGDKFDSFFHDIAGSK